ncbi:hypothetical protein NDU88_005350 [Pleurodeles waltl]|uniref:Uncharacterized protein n=1 Tax=Pleurodeles waltl TaxID=8319 RepID=A0AAV7WUY2_PLEWA|nr:hypothetical protein NDU88_005350 [Pleurodeles waltl]
MRRRLGSRRGLGWEPPVLGTSERGRVKAPKEATRSRRCCLTSLHRYREESPEQDPKGTPAEGRQEPAKVSEDRGGPWDRGGATTHRRRGGAGGRRRGSQSSEGPVRDLPAHAVPELLGPAERRRALRRLLLPYNRLPALRARVRCVTCGTYGCWT